MSLHRVHQPNRSGWQWNTGQVYFGPRAKYQAAVEAFDAYLAQTRKIQPIPDTQSDSDTEKKI